MASFCYRIRSTQKNKLVKIQILFTVGRGNQFYVDSQYMVLTDAWDNKRQTVKSRFTFTDDFTEQQGRELTTTRAASPQAAASAAANRSATTSPASRARWRRAPG